jgi:4'-phosphopantetheinyl transferase
VSPCTPFPGGGAVGIDLEKSREDFTADEVVAQFFAPEEVATLSALPAAPRAELFFRYWTRKEAYCKARGCGLSQDVTRIDASATPRLPAEWFHVSVDRAPDHAVFIRELEVDTGYVAALAVEGRPAPVTLRRWGEG